jgi:hypothetical protein
MDGQTKCHTVFHLQWDHVAEQQDYAVEHISKESVTLNQLVTRLFYFFFSLKYNHYFW